MFSSSAQVPPQCSFRIDGCEPEPTKSGYHASGKTHIPLSDVRIRETALPQSSRPRRCATLALCAIALATTACGCNPSIGLSVDPRTTTLRVGQSFTPIASDVSSCRDRSRSETWSWTTSDTTLVRVEPATGRTTGLATGIATLKGLTTLNGISTEPLVGVVTVTVTVVP